MPDRFHCRPAFTLIELLVVVAVIAILISVLLPALSGARQSAVATRCAGTLRDLGIGTIQYRFENDDELPQIRVDGGGNPVPRPQGDNIGALFGGKLGTLPFFGINTVGAERRPLNAYVWDAPTPSDDSPEAQDYEVTAFESPADTGTTDPFLSSLGFDTSSLYNLIGTSYTLNDHAPDDNPGEELFPTLIPEQGGRMPRVSDTSKTWMIASQPIYNYDDGSDRNQAWYGGSRILANMVFVDGHAKVGVEVAEGPVASTSEYTFLPSPDWLEQFGETGDGPGQ
jgi:prepilin-type N-terminal cleavage/methylation domain-containing protein/prepilin-type processing-associated H-X9-DG protein